MFVVILRHFQSAGSYWRCGALYMSVSRALLCQSNGALYFIK